MILLERYASLRALPHRPLVVRPTPLEAASALGANVLVKRDDLTGGGGKYGGNKVRKLEFLLGEALARGRQSVLTIGGIGSNHVIATAIYGRECGLSTSAILFPQPVTPDVAHKRDVMRELGVQAVRVPKALVPFGGVVAWAKSPKPYLVGPGGSSPLGTLGYVDAALELAAQLDGHIDRIYVPLGSGGTVAGLLVGLKLAGLSDVEVVAVQVVDPPWISARSARKLADKTAALLRAHGVAIEPPWNLRVVTDQLGPGYGAPTPAATDAVERGAKAGLAMETTYGGKTLAALLAAENGDGRCIFWHTYSRAM